MGNVARKEGEAPFAKLADGTPLYPVYRWQRSGRGWQAIRLGRWDGASGEWVGITENGLLFRQVRRKWGSEQPEPQKWVASQ